MTDFRLMLDDITTRIRNERGFVESRPAMSDEDLHYDAAYVDALNWVLGMLDDVGEGRPTSTTKRS